MEQSTSSTVGLAIRIIINTLFLVGAVGNIAALWILHKSAKKRNKKHVLLLRCLAVNDLIAQIGMLVLTQKFKLIPPYWTCVGFVLLRGFAIGSGCVAFVMALERWFALTKPFLYHQVVTYQRIKIFLFSLWSFALLITYLPLFGFGLYYNYHESKCTKLRYAKETKDQIYAFIFFMFGSTLCLCISIFNVMVVWELMRIKSHNRVLIRRVSRSIINNNRFECCMMPRYQQTPEEMAFAKLIAVICIIYVVCWVPQLVSIPMAQLDPKSSYSVIYSKTADMLLCVYFACDPFIYVLQRYIEKGKFLPRCLMRRSTNNSIRTTTTTTLGTPTSVLLQPPQFPAPDNNYLIT